jgi:hypothetical protein
MTKTENGSAGFTAGALSKTEEREELADLGAQKTPAVFDADSAAAEEICYRRHCFAAAFCAGTDSEDKVAEGKLLGLAEDLRVLFHAYIRLTAKRMPMFIGRSTFTPAFDSFTI